MRMFGTPFAEYSSAADESPARGAPPPPSLSRAPPPSGDRERERAGAGKKEHFTAEGVAATLSGLDGVDLSTRSVALRLESELSGKGLSGHEEAALTAALEDWMRITHHVMDYQYVHDMNVYVKSVQTDERDRLDKQYSTIANDVMVKKHMYTMRERDARKLQSRVRIILHSMLFVSAVAFLYSSRAMTGTLGLVLIGVASFAFGVYLVIYLKTSSARRYNDWDSLYFNDGRDVESESATADLDGGEQCETAGSVPFGTVS